MGRAWRWIAALVLGLLLLMLVACENEAPPPTAAPPTVAPATAPVEPTSAGEALAIDADPDEGREVWASAPCQGCHGAEAQGEVGPQLAGTELELKEFLTTVRQGRGRMPAFAESRISDEQLVHVHAWLAAGAAGDGGAQVTSTAASVAQVVASATPQPPTDTPRPDPSATPAPATATQAAPTASSPDTPAPPTDTLIPPTEAPTPTPVPPTATPLPTAAPTASLPTTISASVGRQVWVEAPCSSCHGAGALGNIGPRLAGTGLSADQVLSVVRLGRGQMPAFTQSQVSDLAVRHIHAWLQSLAQPTPTPIAPPNFSTQALTDMWYFVNEMRIRADFAKDLPARQASDDAGKLQIVKAYSGDGLAQVQQVLNRANTALNQVPDENVRNIIREVIRLTQMVEGHFNRALAQNSYGPAWAEAAEAVRICRIDALPWATQAVRDAGLVGTARIRVVDQAGRAVPQAFVTVLTAHTPVGVRADANGRVTIVNVAAVQALPVKAYAQGRVYHEINLNMSPGATVDGTIAIPPIPRAGVAPSISGASISPTAGAGNATITLSVTAIDPQGRLDLAEDQIFALNPTLGSAYVLLHQGNNRYQAQVRLPNLPAGQHTWYFFAVDHECHTSGIRPVSYRVQ